MKRFIVKCFLFLLPVILAFSLTEAFYSTDKGDLLRIGYVADISDYDRDALFSEEFKRKKKFTKISEIDLTQKHNFKVLNIGDSFSQQGNFGYTNYLAEYIDDSILDYDRKLAKNQSPIETLTSILNGDILDSIHVDYIVLETVERNFVRSAMNLNRNEKITLDSLGVLIESKKGKRKRNNKDLLFSGRMKNFIVTNYNYLWDDNAFNSQTYKVPITENLFSTKSNELLFYHEDIDFLKSNNDFDNIMNLHSELNYLSQQLEKKGIKLIVMPAPDKFDFYYEYITNKDNYPKPLFFERFKQMDNRDYLYVDAKSILNSYITEKKDLYFYDDTHWSPWASQLIAKNIESEIREHQSRN